MQTGVPSRQQITRVLGTWPNKLGRRLRRVAVLFAAGALLAGCSGGVVLEPSDAPVLEARSIAQAMMPEDSVVSLGQANAAELALRSSEEFFDSAQVVVLASVAESEAIDRAASLAITLGTPLLLTSEPGEDLAGQTGAASGETGGLNSELLRLGTRAVLTIGEVSLHQLDTTSLVVTPVPRTSEELSTLFEREFTESPAPEDAHAIEELATLHRGEIFEAEGLGTAPAAYGTLPATLASERIEGVSVLVGPDPDYAAAIGTARAAGADIFVSPDPASERDIVDRLATHSGQPVIGIGEEFANRQHFAELVRSMQGGTMLPSGAQRIFRAGGSDVRILTLAADAAMHEPGIDAAEDVFARARTYATEYAGAHGAEFASGAEVDVDATSTDDLTYWADQADEAGQYLILKIKVKVTAEGEVLNALIPYRELLTRASVGVSLDLTAGAEVDSGELNDAVGYVRHIVGEEHLPQKLFIVDLGGDGPGDPGLIGHPEALTQASDEIALTVSITSEAEDRWERNRARFGTDVYWGSSLTKTLHPGEEEDDGEDDAPQPEYPAPSEITWGEDLNLMTFQ